MVQDRVPIATQVNVGLDNVGALLDRELERLERMVRRVAGSTAVREYQRLS